jgi:hypothetical protein
LKPVVICDSLQELLQSISALFLSQFQREEVTSFYCVGKFPKWCWGRMNRKSNPHQQPLLPDSSPPRRDSTFKQKYGRLHQIRTKLKKCDVFAFQPVPRFVKEQQVSVRGLIGTFLFAIVILVYCILTFLRFWQDSPAVSSILMEPSEDLVPFLQTGITFRIADEFAIPRKIFYNESYFRYLTSYIDVVEQDHFPRNVTFVPVVPCNISSWAGWLGEKAFCPESNLFIKGRYQSRNYTFARLDVIACDSRWPYNNSITGEPVQCASDDEVTSLISSGRFNVLYDMPSDDPSTPSSWEATTYMVLPSVWAMYEVQFSMQTAVQGADFLRTFLPQRFQVLKYLTEKYYQRLPSRSPFGGRYVMSLYFRFGAFNTHQERRVATLMDMCGQWWAYSSLIMAVLGSLYFGKYNRAKFYEENPGWDAIDQSFQSKLDRENALRLEGLEARPQEKHIVTNEGEVELNALALTRPTNKSVEEHVSECQDSEAIDFPLLQYE